MVATALGLSGAAGCNGSTRFMPLPDYGPAPVHIDLSVTVPVDAGVVDAGTDSSTD
jgi:hypothetical protein